MSAAAAGGPERTVLEGCYLATVDAAGTEHESGHIVLEGGRITAVGPGRAPVQPPGTVVFDAAGSLVTPGLVNTHHHLYQWITRGLAQDSTLFGWLTTLYPLWARIDAETVHASAAANLAWLALTGCTTSTDHHYVFPAAKVTAWPPRSQQPPRSACGSTPPVGRWTSASATAACPPTPSSRTVTRSLPRPRPRSTPGTTRPSTR